MYSINGKYIKRDKDQKKIIENFAPEPKHSNLATKDDLQMYIDGLKGATMGDIRDFVTSNDMDHKLHGYVDNLKEDVINSLGLQNYALVTDLTNLYLSKNDADAKYAEKTELQAYVGKIDQNSADIINLKSNDSEDVNNLFHQNDENLDESQVDKTKMEHKNKLIVKKVCVTNDDLDNVTDSLCIDKTMVEDIRGKIIGTSDKMSVNNEFCIGSTCITESDLIRLKGSNTPDTI